MTTIADREQVARRVARAAGRLWTWRLPAIACWAIVPLLVSACAASPAREFGPSAASRPAVGASAGSVAAARPFDSPKCDVSFEHMTLELTFTGEDFRDRAMSGRVTYDVRAATGKWGGKVAELPLNAVGMRIEAVSRARRGDSPGDAWRPAAYEHQNDVLSVAFDPPLREGERTAIRVSYRVSNPPLGLHFVKPGELSADRDTTVYSMSEPLQARYWLPCHDWPDARWTSDIFITVPMPYVAVTVGEPVVGAPRAGGVPDGGSVTYHWRQRSAIDPHMLGFAIGKFATLTESGGSGPVLAIYGQEKYSERAKYSLRRAGEMIRYYESLLGVDFPWPRMSHVLIEDHFHGGMEHVGFDMIAPSLLVSEKAGQVSLSPIEFNYVAHMIGHQWFGGLVNYKRITEAWLNEGFGTYLHQMWHSQAYSYDGCVDGPPGDRPSMDWAIDDLWRSARMLASFDKPGRGKPMVNEGIRAPGQIYEFDAGKVYWKGAWVLHMLRSGMGDERFWGAVRTYLKKHRGGAVETLDLLRVMRAACGLSEVKLMGGIRGFGVREFFDQWVYRDGMPLLEIECRWDAAERTCVVAVKQTQKIDEQNPAFRFPLDVFVDAGGERRTRRFAVTRATAEFRIPVPREPDVVCLDPELTVLKHVKTERKPNAWWIAQVRAGPTAHARSAAIEHIGDQHESLAGDAEIAAHELAERLADEREFWGVRRRAAEALGRIGTDAAQAALNAMDLAGVRNPRVRAAIEAARK